MKRKAKTGSGLYHRFFDKSDTAMAVISRNGLVLKANEKFVSLLKSLSFFPENAAAPARDIPDIPDVSHITQLWSLLLPVINGEKTFVVFEIPLHFRSDKLEINHWFNVHAWRVDGPGQQDWLAGIYMEDYTLVRQEEKKLLDGMETAERAMEAKDQFLANMSHEIRTPIQTIIGTTELLQDTNLDHEQNEYSRQVKFSAEVLLSLVNDILDYSKIEAGKMELEHIEFDLEQTIEQAVEMITLEAHKKELAVVTNIPLETNIIIIGDPSKFRQIVINLVKNAVKFTKEGGVVVSSVLTSLDGRDAVRISVADTGIGITEETRARLFSTFMQADASNTRRFGGTGLGLAISRNLVELMNGRIEMLPNEGGGSVFRFDIPIERSENKPPPLPPPEQDGKIRILIVDDREQERTIAVSYLRELGYADITQAESGDSALRIMRAAAAAGRAFQICFIDMIMPVMDGWRLAAEIHNDAEIKQADLVLMVPHGFMGADTKMTLLQWFQAYINKPIKRRSLAETIDLVLNEPRELEAVLDQNPHEESVPAASAGSAVAAAGAGKHKLPGENTLPVLIAEDHPVNQKLFAAILDKLGYSSLLANDGMDALEKAGENRISLVLMDLQMPRMNGYEAAKNLRSRGFTKPIIAITASTLSEERELCQNAGIDDILIKPFRGSDVEKILFKWMPAAEAGKGGGGLQEIPAIPVEEPERIAPAKSEAVFSPAALADSFMDNKELITTLLPRFLERTQTQFEAVRNYKNAEDWESARREAHTIRGAAFTMGGSELGKAASRLESAFKSINRDEMDAAFPPMEEAFIRFKKEAENYLQSGIR